MKLSWTDFKNLVVAQSLAIICDERPAAYYLYVNLNGKNIYCSFLKESPANSDQLDFETNYKAMCDAFMGKN